MVKLYGEQRIFVVGEVVMVLGGVFAGAVVMPLVGVLAGEVVMVLGGVFAGEAVMPRAAGYLAPTVSVAPHP